jgi:hypothetical protein
MSSHDWPRAPSRDTLDTSRSVPPEMTGPRAQPQRQPARALRCALALSLASALSACETFAPPPAAAPPTASIAALYLQPAERSLVEGIRLYEEASFDRAEAALRQSLGEGNQVEVRRPDHYDIGRIARGHLVGPCNDLPQTSFNTA